MRKTGPRQLSFVFADSPSGDGKAERSDASAPRNFLLQKAKRKKTIGPDAGAADTSRLLEAAANDANLARALLSKGAWVKSNIGAMTRAYSPAWFAARMASLKALWHDLHPPQVSVQLTLDF